MLLLLLAALMVAPIQSHANDRAHGPGHPKPQSSNSVDAAGKGVSVDVYDKEPPAAKPNAAKPVAPGSEQNGSSSSLSPANQSQAGVGFEMRFGEGDKETNAKTKAANARKRESGEKNAENLQRTNPSSGR